MSAARSRGKAVASAPVRGSLPAPGALGWTLLVLLAAAAILATVTYRIYDADLWQHLLVGKVLWSTHAVPATQMWTWPTYGQGDVLPSWLFRALLWPFWSAGGVAGLFAWRWLTTLGAFALLWFAARAAGARGPWALVALVWCALFYRYRSQVRPETLVAVLLAAQLWVLERRRARGAGEGARDIGWALVPIAWAWANAHLSYYIGLFVTAVYALESFRTARFAATAQRPLQLTGAALACVAVSFANPFTWRALWQPFEYLLIWRHEPIYQSIGELAPVRWPAYAADFLPLWLALLVGLALWRMRTRGLDLVQALLLVVFVPQALATQRFLGYLAVLVAPFFARDLDAAVQAFAPRVLRSRVATTALAAVLIVLLPLPSLRDAALRTGFGIRWEFYPVRACDWVLEHDVRGRSFNAFGQGGYMLWRFFPERERLPFMDIHQAGTREDRYQAAFAMQDARAWQDLDGKHAFDWVLLPPVLPGAPRLQDFLDADTTTWAMVFSDDAASLWLRRNGRMAALAERERYRWLPAGRARLGALGDSAAANPVARAAIRAELERQRLASPWNARAHNLLANIDLIEGRWREALAQLDTVRAMQPDTPLLDERGRLARDSLAAR